MRTFDGYGFGQEKEDAPEQVDESAVMPAEAAAQVLSGTTYTIGVNDYKTGKPIVGAKATFVVNGQIMAWSLTGKDGVASFTPSVSDVTAINAAGPHAIGWKVSASGYKDGAYSLEDPQILSTSIALEAQPLNIAGMLVPGAIIAAVIGIIVFAKKA